MSGAASAKLRNVAVAGRHLALAWSDGHESYIPFDVLRRACPCALCAKKKVSGTVSTPAAETVPDTFSGTIAALMPVGAYAVQVVWDDGHDTGIYAFDTLRALCPCEDCTGS